MIPTDEVGFATLAEEHRRELHVHCYRMLASFHEAEDAVQDTLLRAWRARERFEGDSLRAWLYRIATNVCLDQLRRNGRRASPASSGAEVPWLEPYPDRLLDELVAPGDEPHAVVVERETIELAFLVALQALPPRQRAALLARDVLGCTAAETASLLETSVAAANSALQRARETLQERLPERRSEWTAPQPTAEERELLARFVEAHERLDAEAALATAAPDIRITMPPYPLVFTGREGMVPLLEHAFGAEREGEWRLLPTGVNRMPAAASYLLRPGDSAYRPFKLDVLRVAGGLVAEVTTFGPASFPDLGLPPSLPA